MPINLRPPEYARKRGFHWTRLVFVTGIIIYIFSMFFAAIYLKTLKMEKDISLSALQANYQLTINEKNNIEEKSILFKNLEKDKKDLEKLLYSSVKWYSCLDLIINTSESELYIESLQGSGTDIYINGRSQKLSVIAGYLSILEQTGLFHQIDYQEVKGDAGGYFYFSLRGQMNTPVEAEDSAV